MPYLQTSNAHLYYEMHSPENGDKLPAVLFLHGLGSSHLDWRRQIEYFQNKYRVVVLDLRGFGKSGKPQQAFSIKSLSDDVHAFLKQLDLAPILTVGLSLGGMVGFQLAESYPGDQKALCVVNTIPEFINRGFKQKMNVWLRFLIVRLLGMKLTGNILSKKLFPNSEQTEMREEFIKNWKLNNKTCYLNAMRAILNFSVTEQLEKIQLPVLYLSGDSDYTPIETKNAYVKKTPNASLQVIANSGHATPIDQADAFNQAVEKFIQSHSD